MKGKRYVIVLSDIELGAGDEFDDFPHPEFLAGFLSDLEQRVGANEIDLVFNGDTFDFLKTSIEGKFPHLINKNIALAKLDRVARAHLQFFQAIEEWLDNASKPRRVYFLVGNHDMELLFPEVQSRIVELCGGSGQIFFPGFELNIGDLHIEHGNQLDNLFSVPPGEPFITHGGEEILNLPWATVTLMNVILPHREDFYELDRVKPRELVFELIPSLKEFVLGVLWRYWTTDFIRSNDPLKKVRWSMVREAFKRSFMFNPDVEIENITVQRMRTHNDFKVYVLGHLHDPKITSYGNRRLIELGCIRDEYMYELEDKSFTPIAKSYAEICMVRNQVETANLLEIAPLEDCYKRLPRPLESYHDVLARKLGTAEERLKDKLDIENQEEKEKSEEG